MTSLIAAKPQPEKDGSVSPADVVRTMSPEDKHAVFLLLLREALAVHGECGVLPIEDEAGKAFGYYVPPVAAQQFSDRTWSEMPEAVREAFNRPVKDVDNCISAEQMLAILSPGDSKRP